MKIFQYRGVCVDWDKLPTKDEVIECLILNGPNDSSISSYREVFRETYSNELMVRVPVSDGTCLGEVIFPVREGFLVLPYDRVDAEMFECFDIEAAQLMGHRQAENLRVLYEEFSAQVSLALKSVCVILGSHADELEGTVT